MTDNNKSTPSNNSKRSHTFATTTRSRCQAKILGLRTVRLGLWCCSLGFLAWGFIAPGFRDAEGYLKGTFGWPLGVSLALLVLGWAVPGGLRNFAIWFALALVGQVAALQLIDAGPLLHYQHYEPFDRALATNLGSLLFLVVQTVIVFAGLKGRWSKIIAWTRSSFKVWQLIGIGLIFFFSGAAVQRDISLYLQDLLLATFVQAVNLGCIVLMVWALPEDALVSVKQRIEKFFGKPAQEDATKPKNVDRFAVVAAVWVFVLASVLNLVSYESHPHITDEVAYLYQARFLAAGAVALPAPPVPDAFDIYLMEFKGDTWYPVTYFGWPAILAVGVRLGMPGLVNPLLGGLNVLLAFYLLHELYDRRIARLAVLLLAVSPWYVFMAMNFMTHTLTLTCALVAAVAVVQARQTGNAVWGMIAGAGVGFASLTRPPEGLIVGGVVGLWVMGIGGRRLKLSGLITFALGTIFVAGTVLPFNEALSGKPTVFPINAYFDQHYGPGSNDLGFGPRGFGWPVQPFPEHTPIAAMINANLNAFSINIELFGWSTGSLLLAALIVFSRSLRKSDYIMLAVCAATFVLYFFYYFSGGPDFGARYWFLMLVPLVALSVRGIFLFQEKLGVVAARSPGNGTRVLVAVLSLSLITLINYFPWRAIDKYHNFWGMRPDIVRLDQEYKFGKSLVLIQGNESHPDFASAAIYNPLDWNADAPVYAWDRNDAVRAQLLQAFEDRPIWIVQAPSITHTGYKVVEGPLSAQDLARRTAAP